VALSALRYREKKERDRRGRGGRGLGERSENLKKKSYTLFVLSEGEGEAKRLLGLEREFQTPLKAYLITGGSRFI